jgi:DNA-binding SARP family transcriptional activator
VDEGRGAIGEHNPSAASERLRDALALWRGPALADSAFETFAQEEIARLEELRLGVREDLLAVTLELGLHSDVTAELDSLVSSDPLRERLTALLMTALYRSGRQADALSAYQRLRAILLDELGIDP